jgi:hypothetical protein
MEGLAAAKIESRKDQCYEDRFYRLKVRLQEIEPEAWRRFVVPGSITRDLN